MKKKGIILVMLLLLLTGMGVSSCSELRSEFNPHEWRYAPFRDIPPSWENDFGRPGPDGGEGVWS